MLKYVDTKVVFREVPGEITLAINISGCIYNCRNCHSPWLSENKGTLLNFTEIDKLVRANNGITCIAFMGGDRDPFMINQLAKHIRSNHNKINIAWYSGSQELSKEIELCNFDFIKLGPYIEEKGPLNNPNTNQIFYHVYVDDNGEYNMIDITPSFWNETIN